MYAPCVFLVPKGARRGRWAPGTGVTYSREPLCGCWEPSHTACGDKQHDSYHFLEHSLCPITVDTWQHPIAAHKHNRTDSVQAMFQVRKVRLNGYRNWPRMSGKKTEPLTPSPKVPAGFGWGECDHFELRRRNRGPQQRRRGGRMSKTACPPAAPQAGCCPERRVSHSHPRRLLRGPEPGWCRTVPGCRLHLEGS